METVAHIYEKLESSIERYRKNKTLVSPTDLKGKYRVPFEKLKAQLADELEEYLKAYSLEGLQLVQDSNGWLEGFVADVNRIFKEADMGKRVGHAVFREYDLNKVKKLAEELRIRIYNEAWKPYFRKHLCLWVTEECVAEENPHTPKIYNSLVDKFYDQDAGVWLSSDWGKKPAVLIYIQEKGNQHEQ